MKKKQQLFKALDAFIADVGYAEVRLDELLHDIQHVHPSEICKDAEQIATDLFMNAIEFSKCIEKYKHEIQTQ